MATGSDIDDTIDKIGVTFDTAGRVDKVTSYSNLSVSNEVEFAYTKLWQVESIKQEYEGAVDASTLSVDYTYDTQPEGTGNYSRLQMLTYPSGDYGSSTRSELDYLYFDSPVLGDDRISRVTKMQFDGSDVVSYRRVGLHRMAIVDYVNPDIQLDRYVAANGSRTQGVYPGWDRFGRVKHHAWVDGDLTTHATETDIPNIPPIVELEYRYDKNSNRTHRLDARPGAKLPNRDFEYHYDDLDRLTAADRGQWNSTTSVIDPESTGGSQAWTLDMLGNWDAFAWDTDGNLATYEEEDDRSHNFANEITQRVVDPGPDTLSLSNDEAGNLRTMDRSPTLTDTYTHDAWNRLVKITNTGGDVAEYEFNGLHWRTRKRADTAEALDGTMDEERVFYYTANWQLLEEHIDDNYTGSFTADRKGQHIWGIRYIDDAVARRTLDPSTTPTSVNYHYLTDAQFSTVRVISFAGAVVERVSYDPYGQARHHWKEDLDNDGDYDATDDLIPVANKSIGDPDYNVDADLNRDGSVNILDAALKGIHTDALPAGWISDPGGPGSSVGFDGYVFNAENGQYLVRYRCYDPMLGRWLRRDPIGYFDSANLFTAFLANPLSLLDSLGLCCTPPWNCDYELQHGKNYDDALGPRIGGKRTVVRHFYDSKGNYKGTSDPFNPCDVDAVANIELITRNKEYLTWANKNAGRTAAVLGTVIVVGGVAYAVLTPIDEGAFASYAALKGLQLVRKGGKIFKVVDGKLSDLAEAEAEAAAAAGRAGHLTRVQIKDGMKLPVDDALDLAGDFLGPNYTEIKPGIFVSEDGLRKVRMLDCDLDGGVLPPHINFETYIPRQGRPGHIKRKSNKHVIIEE